MCSADVQESLAVPDRVSMVVQGAHETQIRRNSDVQSLNQVQWC